MSGIDRASRTITTLPQGVLIASTAWVPLTTPFVQPPGCDDHWVQFNTRAGAVWNYQPSSCTPDGAKVHSLGMCIDGYYMAEVVEFRTAGYTSGGSRIWGARCC